MYPSRNLIGRRGSRIEFYCLCDKTYSYIQYDLQLIRWDVGSKQFSTVKLIASLTLQT